MNLRSEPLVEVVNDLQIIPAPAPSLPAHIDVIQVAASLAPRDGGPATGIVALNVALRQQGLSAIVITTNADGARGRLPAHRSGLVEQDGALIYYGRRSWPFRLKNSWQQGRLIWKLAPRAAVIHIHGVYLAHSVWAYFAARRFRVPYVIQPHGTLEPYQEREGRLYKGLFNRIAGNAVLNNAHFFVAASTAESRNLSKRLPSSQSKVFPLGVSLPSARRPSGLSSQQLANLQSVPRDRRVAFVGRLANKKRPDVLVDAWNHSAIQDAILLIAGPAEDWTHEELRKRLSPRKAGQVISLEQLDRPEVAWVLQHCGIFVLPSENENFGIAVAEAMASGCAVISTKGTAAADHVISALSGIVLPSASPTSLVAALAELLGNEAEVRAMGDRGRRYAERFLTWGGLASALSRSYATDQQKADTL